jgi:predicted O-methyltransferase YrrM
MQIANLTLRSWVQEAIGWVFDFFDLGVFHPVREVERRALAQTVDYIEANMPEAVGYYSGKKALEHALRLVPARGHLLEFGVYKGGSINVIARHNPKRTVHGFDSFHGLPHDWHGWRATRGTFSLNGRFPRVRSNVELHAGLFDETLPTWLERNPGPIALAHIDCDLYSSAKTVLDLIGPRIGPGTVLVFDEYFNFPFWRDHEWKAFREIVDRLSLKYRYLAYARTQVAVVIM